VDIPLANPVFEPYTESEGFQSLRRRVAELNARNRERILSLICDKNPAPNAWRPLDSTCEGRQRS